MILNLFTIVILFVAGLSILLGVFLALSSLNLYRKWGKQLSQEGRSKGEEWAYLMALVAVVVLIVRIMSWPLFYATLASYVPLVQGAMCIYGVTRISPNLSNFLQVLKPVVFFLIGAWLILHHLDRTTKTSPLMRRKLLFLFIVSLFVSIDGGLDTLYFLSLNPRTPVSCCTTIFDIPSRATALISRSILGPMYEGFMLPLYYTSNLALLASLGFILWKGPLETNPKRRGIMGGVLLFTIINLTVTGLALIETIAPRLMGLPHHHDPYCLPLHVPDSPFIIALFMLGTFAPGWALMIEFLGWEKETAAIIPLYLRRLYGLSFLSLSASLAMVSVHLLIPR